MIPGQWPVLLLLLLGARVNNARDGNTTSVAHHRNCQISAKAKQGLSTQSNDIKNFDGNSTRTLNANPNLNLSNSKEVNNNDSQLFSASQVLGNILPPHVNMMLIISDEDRLDTQVRGNYETIDSIYTGNKNKNISGISPYKKFPSTRRFIDFGYKYINRSMLTNVILSNHSTNNYNDKPVSNNKMAIQKSPQVNKIMTNSNVELHSIVRETYRVTSTNYRTQIKLQYSKVSCSDGKQSCKSDIDAHEHHKSNKVLYLNDDPISRFESTSQSYQTDLPPHKKLNINPFILPDQLESDPKKHNLSDSQIRLGKEYQKNKGKKIEIQLINSDNQGLSYKNKNIHKINDNNGKINKHRLPSKYDSTGGITSDKKFSKNSQKILNISDKKTYNNSVNLNNLSISKYSHATNIDEKLSITDADGFPPFVDNLPTGPFFDANGSNNVTALRNHSANLNCRVNQIGNRTVSWLRHRDTHLLTVGRYTYTTDQRFRALHMPGSEDWPLVISETEPSDAGLYECQISTTPPLKHLVWLRIVEAQTEVMGGPDIYINTGSSVNLTCLVQFTPQPPTFIVWHHNGKVISHSSERGGVSVVTVVQGPHDTTSSLVLRHATTADSGTYSCHPSYGPVHQLAVHILDGEDPAAIQRGTFLSANVNSSILVLVLQLLLLHIATQT